MIKRSEFPKIYFGWWIMIVSAVLSGLSGGFRNLGFSALFKPIAGELGLNRTGTSMAAGISTLQNGFSFALAGWLSDRYGPKWIIVTGTFIMGAGLILMYFINSPWNYNLVWGVLVAGGSTLGFSISQDKMLINWFISKRGLAFGLRFAFIGILVAILLPILSWLIICKGWRTTCVIWGVIILAGIPLELCFMRQKRPEYYGLLPDGAKPKPSAIANPGHTIAQVMEYAAGLQEIEFTLKEAIKTTTFWMLTIAWTFYGILFSGITIHLIPFLTDMGFDPITAGSMMGMMVFFATPSRLIGGIIADRVKKEQQKYLLSGTFICMALGIAVLILGQSTKAIYIFLILMGLGSGGFIPLDIVIRGRFFGRKSYGSIQGTSVILASLFQCFSPIYTGWVYDTTGSYMNAFILYMSIAVFTAFFVSQLHPPKTPIKENSICI